MKIVHVCPSEAFGGTEAVAETLHQLGLRAGWDSSLVLPVVRDAAATRVRWRSWAASLRLRADLVHAHLPSPDRLGAALLAARALPLVVTFHLLPHDQDWPRDRVTKLPTPKLLGLARWRPRTRWVALSRQDQTALARWLGTVPQVVRNAPPEAALAPALPWPPGIRLASVGRLHHQKGFDRMLRALAQPPARALAWHWTVLGEGPERAGLEALRDELGLRDRVRFAGAMPSSAVMRGADLVLAPSRYEGMPLVPLEAAEAGVPVLASPIGAHHELFGGATAALLPADECAWPNHLAMMMQDAEARELLRRQCLAVLGTQPRQALWRAYTSVYQEILHP
jgi:glycosyltransferase involved in cell wall biosynthesis